MSSYDSGDANELTVHLDRFDAAWSSGGQPPRIEDYLPRPTDGDGGTSRPPPEVLKVLVELVAIDLWHRWNRAGNGDTVALASTVNIGDGDGLPSRPSLDDYLTCYPQLGGLDELPIELIGEEYRARHLWGDKPAVDSYVARFPQQAAAIRRRCAAIERGIVEESAGTNDGAGRNGQLPRQFGDYTLLKELGQGGMGVVYKARQISADRLVALKLIRPDQLSQFLPEEREKMLSRFRNEVHAAAKLDHEHVVTVYDVGEVDGQSYYAMRFVDGESLKDKLADGPLEPEDAARYMEQVASALAEAHDHGILHRDLKPHNVMVDAKTDRALLADFGLAKLTEGDQQLTATESAIGSPPYMSPEQTLDAAKGERSQRHLRLGRDPVSPADGASAVSGRQRRGDDAPGTNEGAGQPTGVKPRRAQGCRYDHAEVLGKRSNQAVRLGAGISRGVRALPTRRTS